LSNFRWALQSGMHPLLLNPVFADLGLPVAFISFFLLLGLGSCVIWIWALVSCIKNEPSAGSTKIVWVLVILFLHFIGALAYLLIRRPQRIRESGH
jgi:hypothetical protein